jgi:hypothetical protein
MKKTLSFRHIFVACCAFSFCFYLIYFIPWNEIARQQINYLTVVLGTDKREGRTTLAEFHSGRSQSESEVGVSLSHKDVPQPNVQMRVLLRNEDPVVEEELQRVFSNCFGYTLIGKKPVSIEYCSRPEFNSNLAHKKRFFTLLERMFSNSSRFILKTFHYSNSYSEIILIDKSSLAELIKKNSYLFRFIKNQYGSIRKFHRSLMNPNMHIVDCFHKDLVAIGIALGYGEENSRYYQRYLEVGFYLKKYPLVCLLPIDPKPMPDLITREPTRCLTEDLPYKPIVPEVLANTFTSLEDEWRWMRTVRNKDYYEVAVPYLFQMPFFISKKSAETANILRQYSLARDKLAKLFYEKKFSEAIAEEVVKK